MTELNVRHGEFSFERHYKHGRLTARHRVTDADGKFVRSDEYERVEVALGDRVQTDREVKGPVFRWRGPDGVVTEGAVVATLLFEGAERFEAVEAETKKPYVLITNVDFVTPLPDAGMRFEANALLISPPRAIDMRTTASLRGFGTSGSDPTFTVHFNTHDPSFEIVDAQDNSAIFIGDDGVEKPLFKGGILKVGGREFFVQASDADQPIGVQEFDPDAIRDVWADLTYIVAKYHRPPFMKVVTYLPVEGILGGEFDLLIDPRGESKTSRTAELRRANEGFREALRQVEALRAPLAPGLLP